MTTGMTGMTGATGTVPPWVPPPPGALAHTSGRISPLRRTPVRLFLACLVILVAAVPWRRGAFYTGGTDAVVVLKAALTLAAFGLVVLAPSRGVPWSRLRAGPVTWLVLYLGIATAGAFLADEALASLVLAARLTLLTATIVLLFRRYPSDLVLSALTGAMLALALVSGATGVGSLASEGRLYGGIPPTNANEIALLVSVPLLCLAWRTVQRTARAVETFAILPLVGVLWLTGTRTGLAAVGLGLVLLVAMAPRIPVPVAVTGVLAVPVLLYLAFWTPLLSSYLTRGDSAGILTLNSRTVAWSAALDYPDTMVEWLLGHGLSVKVIPVSALYRNEQMLDSTWISALVQAGVLGSAVLALLVLTTLVRVLTVAQPLRPLLLATLVVLTVTSWLESGMFDTSVTFIVFLAFAMTAQETGHQTGPETAPETGPAIDAGRSA